MDDNGFLTALVVFLLSLDASIIFYIFTLDLVKSILALLVFMTSVVIILGIVMEVF